MWPGPAIIRSGMGGRRRGSIGSIRRSAYLPALVAERLDDLFRRRVHAEHPAVLVPVVVARRCLDQAEAIGDRAEARTHELIVIGMVDLQRAEAQGGQLFDQLVGTRAVVALRPD